MTLFHVGFPRMQTLEIGFSLQRFIRECQQDCTTEGGEEAEGSQRSHKVDPTRAPASPMGISGARRAFQSHHELGHHAPLCSCPHQSSDTGCPENWHEEGPPSQLSPVPGVTAKGRLSANSTSSSS
jgi:hypothetical protein